jgi:hypothetical protein
MEIECRLAEKFEHIPNCAIKMAMSFTYENDLNQNGARKMKKPRVLGAPMVGCAAQMRR